MSQQIVTLVFTDLVNSTALKDQLPGGDITARNHAYFDTILTPHRQRVEAGLAVYGGRVVKTEGDAYFLDFSTPTQAVGWAVEVQASHLQNPISTPLGPLQVKIGMHTGAPLRDGSDYIGHEVDCAARVAALATGGQIVLSEVTAGMVRESHITDIALYAHGERELKGIGRVPVYEVLHAAHPASQPLKEPPSSNNLPAPATAFVGRAAQITAWGELLRQRDSLGAPALRLLTLIGFGGMGKTRSALQLATLCAEEFSAEFPNGVYWIELAEARTKDAMLQRIAHDLNFYMQTPPSAREQIFNYLHKQHLLLVLDNTEQIPDAGEIVKELLDAAPRLQCLVTTRRALGLLAERLVEVPPLPDAEAQQLFVERARARKADFSLTPDNAADVAELCRRLEGVPLALELAASRIAMSAPREILNRLDQRFRILQTRAPDLPARQRALRGAIDWSYELLGDEDKSLFAQLAAFARGFTADDAEIVCDVFDGFEGLHELQSHSFLSSETDAVTQETRFRMLEAVRDYAAEKLLELPDEGKDVRLRHAEHFLGLTRTCIGKLRTPGEGVALQQLAAAFDNVVAALDWAQRANEYQLCAELALAAGTFLERRGFYREAVRRIQMGLDAVAHLLPQQAQLPAELWRERAGLHLDESEPADARRAAQEALARFEQLDDRRGQAYCLNLLGLAARDEKDFVAARENMTKALQEFEQAGDAVGIATARTNLGAIEYDDPAGSRAAAAQHWQEALRLRCRQGDKRGIAETSNNLGVSAHEQGALDEAWRYYEEALRFEQELGHVFGVGRSLFNIGEVAELKGDVNRACRLFAAAESLFDKVGSPYQPHAASSLQNVAARLNSDVASMIALRQMVQDKSLDELVTWALAYAA